jgi:hypothetical protein
MIQSNQRDCHCHKASRFQSVLEASTITRVWRIWRRPTAKLSRKIMRRILFAASVPIFFALVGPSPSSLVQQAAVPQSGAPAGATIDKTTAAAIAAEGELKATTRTFQGDNPSAVYRYYWWHDGCYVRYQSGDYQPVTADYCRR